MAENKVRYGIKGLHYAVATEAQDGSLTYDTPKPYPGSVSLTLDTRGEAVEFYADDRLYFSETTNDGYDGTLTTAELPIDFRVDVLGDTLDEDTKVLTENANAKPKKVALMYQFDGDVSETYHVLYNVTISRPGESGETNTATKTIATNELSFVAAKRIDGVVKRRTTADTPQATKEGWYTEVFDIAPVVEGP